MIWLMLLTAFSLIIIIEVPLMLVKQMWKELAVFSIILGLGMGMSFAAILELPLPNPTHITAVIFEPVYNLIISLLDQKSVSY